MSAVLANLAPWALVGLFVLLLLGHACIELGLFEGDSCESQFPRARALGAVPARVQLHHAVAWIAYRLGTGIGAALVIAQIAVLLWLLWRLVCAPWGWLVLLFLLAIGLMKFIGFCLAIGAICGEPDWRDDRDDW